MQIQTADLGPGDFPPRKYKKVYLLFLLVIVFFLGMQFGRADLSVSEGRLKIFVERNRDQGPQEVNWQLLWDAIAAINEKYVDRPADLQKILYGAVSGAVASLDDPYSLFLPPQEAKDFQEELRGNFEGIGAEIAIKHQQLVVVAPLDDSPALKAGLRAGDYIQKIDGQESRDLTLEQAVNKIRGPSGTEVTLTIFHKGETDSLDLKITRTRIEIKSLSLEIREVRGKKIGYLKLRRFGEETKGELDKAVSDLLLLNVSSVVLDLRNNPGGFLDSAVDVASLWIPAEEVVVIQKFGDGSEEVYRSAGRNRLTSLPTIVLVNGGSASASEIVAGALKDYGRAKLVGEKTFGKGSVQELLDLRDQAELKLTIAKWLTPKGHDLNKEGLEPDVKIELTDEDFEADRDPQLEKALELLAPGLLP